MLNEKLKLILKNKIINTNVDLLIEFMEKNDINYYMADLNGPLGMATFDGVYININSFEKRSLDEKILFFVILHETGHMKRMQKMGKEYVLSNLSNPEFDKFFNHVIEEELIADKYASLVYFILNKEEYPSYFTQQLHLDENKEMYKNTARGFFNCIENDETKYNEFIKKFIKKIY